MYIKLLFLIISFFIAPICFSQISDRISCNNEDIQLASNVTAYIRGKKGKDKIIWRFFYKKFELQLSDPSFEVIRFNITWDDRRNNLIAVRVNKGHVVFPDIETPDKTDKEKYSLKNIAPGTLIAFDNILIAKDGICYRIPPFIIFTTL